jgi:exopolysaccharide biosynthesis polyprenyl glycosylphosphotransferase
MSRDAIDGVIQANPRASDEQNLSLVEFCRQKGLQFSFVPNLFEVQRNIIELDNFQGVPVIKLKNTPLDGWGKVAKRIVDIAASLICLIITLPLFLVIYLVIRIDSSGPGIYWHIRAGQKKNFKFYKFRTMYTHLSQGEKFGSDQAEQVLKELLEKNKDGSRSGPLWKVKDDPRVTRIGRFLRRTKLDELPQFWNVLKGDMSMVGPRAHMVEQVEQYKNSYGRIFSIKPGIFGLTQIAQISWPTLPFEEEIKLDIYYIENWSLWWDIKILFKSAYTLFFAPKPRDDY